MLDFGINLYFIKSLKFKLNKPIKIGNSLNTNCVSLHFGKNYFFKLYLDLYVYI